MRFLTAERLLVALLPALAGCELTGPSVRIFDGPTDSVFVLPAIVFDPDGERPVELPAPELLVDGLGLHAVATARDTASGDPPMRVELDVIVRNPADTAVTVELDGCTVMPWIYPTRARRNAVVRWDHDGWECQQAPYAEVVGPGDSLRLSTRVDAAGLGEMGPDGRYYFSAELRIGSGSTMLTAGSADVQLQEDGLSYAVSLEREGDGLRAQVEVANGAAVGILAYYGNCALGLALYRDADRRDPPVRWDAQELCLGYLAERTIAPGASLLADEFARSFDPERLPELAGGVYLLEVQLELNWRTLRFPMGTLVIG